ncbi:pyrroline-5-carboxylate reductase [Rhodopila sp.]|jgi:pyrroline-5-carboxylate reductase|uniref:pyrroline-5-carboxylate reductase n=1 Tax=Rhodopila sp. TaxID=2480087 RepID=UPI002C2F2905|nr:pyrroline-5-carboxylate reductase [Rhodopila sp.]HVZ08994.1 pyrroline-5-carboxylate reductase [Rhodopila sp.]
MSGTSSSLGAIPPILLVGCGRMGGAMLSGWREQGLAPSYAVDPSPAAASFAGPDMTVVADMARVPAGFAPAAVVLAVKPQNAAATLPAYQRFAVGSVFLSIMAGRTIDGMAALLGTRAPIVRAMPNTPAAVRQGVTVACPSATVTRPQRDLCDRLLQAIGAVAWVDQEGLLDPVTAVSGSGPAYVFLLAELMEKAAIEQGIPAELARLLARRTVSGSGALLAASPEDASALRVAVTSPGGTTAAALSVMMAPEAWPRTVSEAIAAATRRSRELAG